MLVEQLFQLVSSNLPENMWNHLFNTPTHLTSFLRLFTDSFHIQSNIVTLIQHPKVPQKINDISFDLSPKPIKPPKSLTTNNANFSTENDTSPTSTISDNENNKKRAVSPEKIQKELEKEEEKQEIPEKQTQNTNQNVNLILSPRMVTKPSINDRLKIGRINNNCPENERKSEDIVDKVKEDEKPQGVNFRLGKYKDVDKRIGSVQNQNDTNNGKFFYFNE